MSDEEPLPDGPLTPEEQAIVASLSTEFTQRIDSALLAQAKSSWRKVAMLVALTMMDPELGAPGLPDIYYANRVKKLVEAGLLESAGNLDYMRYSEVRLPASK